MVEESAAERHACQVKGKRLALTASVVRWYPFCGGTPRNAPIQRESAA